jgi:membrane protease YdiL (CAAX protease family)
MTIIKNFIKRHHLLIYFISVFIISWGTILLLVGPDGIPASAEQMVVLGMAMLLGPTTAGILLIGLTAGKVGYHDLLSRLLRWRISARWYAVALLTAPLATIAILLALSLLSPKFIPSIVISNDRVTLVMMGIVGGLMVGFFEEIGWTGFAIPQMRLRYNIPVTGLIVGLIWGAWHFLLFWENDSFTAAFPLALLLARLFSWLPAYRILMVWVYDRSESLFVAMLMHVSLVATLAIIDPSLTGVELLTLILVRAVVLWIIVAMVTMNNRLQFGKAGSGQTR